MENISQTLITQNVDGLSSRALDEVLEKKGQDRSHVFPIYEMHGRLVDTICTACERRERNIEDEALCPALAAAGAPPPSGEDAHRSADSDAVADIPLKELPRCKQCGGLLRPGVVWFGETPQYMDIIWTLVEQADMCIVVGTSSTVCKLLCVSCNSADLLRCFWQVYPAAGFAAEVSDRGGKVAVFNLERTDGDDEADFLFLGPCEQTLPDALFNSSGSLLKE